jgi:hypothetical protein
MVVIGQKTQQRRRIRADLIVANFKFGRGMNQY